MSFKRTIPWTSQPQYPARINSQWAKRIPNAMIQSLGMSVNGSPVTTIGTVGKVATPGGVMSAHASAATNIQRTPFINPYATGNGNGMWLLVQFTTATNADKVVAGLGSDSGDPGNTLFMANIDVDGTFRSFHGGSNGNAAIQDSGVVVTDGKVHTALMFTTTSASGTTVYFKGFLDGIKYVDSSEAVSIGNLNYAYLVAGGTRRTTDINGFDGNVGLVAVILDDMPDSVAASITRNPWQIFEPLKRNIYVEAASGSSTGLVTRRFPHLIQPQYPVRLSPELPVGTIAYIGGQKRLAGGQYAESGTITNSVTRGGRAVSSATTDSYINAGRTVHAQIGAHTVIFQFVALDSTMRYVQGNVSDGGSYIEDIRINSDAAEVTSAGRIAVQFRSLVDGIQLHGYANVNLFAPGELVTAAVRMISATAIEIWVNGVSQAVTYSNTGPYNTNTNLSQYPLDLLNRNVRDVHSSGTNVDLLLWARIPSNALDLRNLTSSPSAPWRIFEPLKRNIYVSAAASGVSGTIAATMAAFTSSITGTTTIVGSMAQTVAAAVSVITGSTTITGTIAKTLDNDVGNLQGSTGSTSGTIAVTAQSDTADMAGKTTIVGTMNASTENATSNATGSTTILGQMAASVSNFIAAMTDAVGGIVARLLSLLGVGS